MSGELSDKTTRHVIHRPFEDSSTQQLSVRFTDVTRCVDGNSRRAGCLPPGAAPRPHHMTDDRVFISTRSMTSVVDEDGDDDDDDDDSLMTGNITTNITANNGKQQRHYHFGLFTFNSSNIVNVINSQ